MLTMTPEQIEARAKRLAQLPGTVRRHTLADDFPKKMEAAVKAKKVKRKLPTESNLLQLQLVKAGYTATLEYRFHETRKWRIDVALIEQKIAVEIDGGIFTQGRHTRGAGFLADMEKSNALATAGWRLFRFTPRQVRKGEAIETLVKCLEGA